MEKRIPPSRLAQATGGAVFSPESAEFAGEFLDALVVVLRGDGATFVNRAGRAYLGAFDEFTRFDGFARDDAWRAVVHVEDHPRLAAALDAARAANDKVELEIRVRRHDGEFRWFKARLAAALASPADSSPRLSASIAMTAEVDWLFVATEIHDSKAQAEALFRYRQQIDTHFRFTPIAVVECSVQGKLLDCNPAAERIFGFKREDVVGADAVKLCVAPEAAAEVGRRMSELVATKRSFHSSNGNRTVDGRPIVGEWFNSPVLDAQGNVTSILTSMLDVTEYRRVQDALLESERQYRLLAENSRDIVSLHDLNCAYVYVSPSLTRMTGFAPEELLGTDAYRMVPAEDRDRVRTRAHERLFDGGSALFEWRWVRKDGSHFWAETAAQLVRDELGNPWRILATTRDITARYHAKQALRESEEAWRSLVENSPDYIATLDENGKIIFINREPAADHDGAAGNGDGGLDVDADDGVVGRPLLDFTPATDADALTSLMNEALQSGRTQSIVSPLDWSGEPRWFQLRIVPTFYEGRAVSNTLIATDVTDSRRAAEALRTSEEQFRQIAENMREACWIMEVDPPRWTYISPAFETITGRRHDSVYDDPFAWSQIVHPDDRHLLPPDETSWRSQMTRDWDREYRIVRADGQVRWVKDRGFPLRGPAGRVTRVTGVFEDVTSRKAHEELLVEHAERLDQLVQERTGQVRELERQRTDVEKIVATGRMAARIAHEINNPLAGIRSAFDLVKDAVVPEHPYAHYVPRITNEIDRISRIVRQMFEVYRPEAEHAADFVLDDCVRDVVAMVGPATRESGVEVVCDCGLGARRVRLPEHSFRQVLHNLIRNAVEASTPGSSVTVRTRDGKALQVSVIDRGSGIPEKIRPEIFEPFFTTKGHRARPGLGLGLSVSDGLVRAMGGAIELECSADGGSHFRVCLPRPDKEGT